VSGTTVAKTIRGGDSVVQALKANGIDVVFGIPGVHTLDIYDALIEDPELIHILARHEQGAGYMADGYARATGKPGTALIVTGPGLTNISTAVGQAYADSAPVFVIATNQERRHLDMMVGNLHELTDQLGFMKPITKWSQRAMEAADLPELVAQAIEALTSGRPRPVHLEIPLDLLAEPVEAPEIRIARRRVEKPSAKDIDAAAELISNAGRIMIFAGGGASTTEVAPLLSKLAEELGAPVITSVTGKGAISYDHPYCAGAFGYRWSADNPTTALMKGSDLVIAIGTGLGVRTTGEGTMPLPGKMIHIDIDPAELEVGNYERTVGVVADAAAAIEALLERVTAGTKPEGRWSTDEVRIVREQLLAPADERAARYVPYVRALRDGMERDAILVNDMTMLAYEAVRYFPTYVPRSYFFPRGFGTLGSAMPTALGAKVGCPDRQVVSIAGDGGFQFTLEELGAAVHHQIPVQIVIFNDGTHSAVKAAQHRTYPGRFIAVDLVNPDYVKMADAYGMKAYRPESPEALAAVLKETRSLNEPVLIDVPVNFERYES
jgi:acetolactate synthase I/II/III large subunit